MVYLAIAFIFALTCRTIYELNATLVDVPRRCLIHISVSRPPNDWNLRNAKRTEAENFCFVHPRHELVRTVKRFDVWLSVMRSSFHAAYHTKKPITMDTHPIPTAFQRTEHGLRTDSARGGYPRRTGKSKRQKSRRAKRERSGHCEHGNLAASSLDCSCVHFSCLLDG